MAFPFDEDILNADVADTGASLEDDRTPFRVDESPGFDQALLDNEEVLTPHVNEGAEQNLKPARRGNPAMAAEMDRIVEQTGQSPLAVERDLDEARAVAEEHGFDADILSGTAPTLMREYASDSAFAGMAYDDHNSLGKIEGGIRAYLREMYEHIIVGKEQVIVGDLGTRSGFADTGFGIAALTPEERDDLDRRSTRMEQLGQHNYGYIESLPFKVAEQIPVLADFAIANAQGAAAGAVVGAAAGSVIPGVGTAAGAVLGGGIGSTVTRFVHAFTMEGGLGYVELKNWRDPDTGQALTEDQALLGFYVIGSVNALLEGAGLGFTTRLGRRAVSQVIARNLKDITLDKGRADILRNVMKAVVGEGVTEGLQEIAPIAYPLVAKANDPRFPDYTSEDAWADFSTKENLYRVLDAALVGAFVGGTVSGVSAPFVSRSNERARNRAVATQNMLETVSEGAAKSELLQRSEDRFTRYVGKVMQDANIDVQNVFIPITKIDEFLTENPEVRVESIANTLSTTVEELQAARARDGDIVVDFADYVAKVSTNELHQHLKRHVRLYEGDETMEQIEERESQDRRKEKVQHKQLIELMKGREVEDQSLQRLYLLVLDQVKKAVPNAGQAANNAAFFTRAYLTLARNEGQDALELFKRKGFQIGGIGSNIINLALSDVEQDGQLFSRAASEGVPAAAWFDNEMLARMVESATTYEPEGSPIGHAARIDIDVFLDITTASDKQLTDIESGEFPFQTTALGDEGETQEIDTEQLFDPREFDVSARFGGHTFLRVEPTGKVYSHEGRHRAAALKRGGATTMPVVIWTRGPGLPVPDRLLSQFKHGAKGTSHPAPESVPLTQANLESGALGRAVGIESVGIELLRQTETKPARETFEQRVPGVHEDFPVLPIGRVEKGFIDVLEEVDGDREQLTTDRLKKIKGAPVPRPNIADSANVDANVRPRSYKDLKAGVRWAQREGHALDWYKEFGDGLAEVVGTENMLEASILFGITSPQSSPESNLVVTLQVMIEARRINPTEDIAGFQEALLALRESIGAPMTSNQIGQIVRLYNSGTYVSNSRLKVPTFAQLIRDRHDNVFNPYSVQDIHMARAFGYLFGKKDKQTGKIKRDHMFNNAEQSRYAQTMTSLLAEDMGLKADQVQALMWFWSKKNLAPTKETTPGIWESSSGKALPQVREIAAMQADGTFDRNRPLTQALVEDPERTVPYFESTVQVDPWTNYKLNAELLEVAKARAPRAIVSVNPGEARGYGFPPETTSEQLLEFTQAVLDDITDAGGQIAYLKRLGIRHETNIVMGTWGRLEPSIEIILPGETMETASQVAAVMGHALLQDAAIMSKPDPDNGWMHGILLRKADGQPFVDEDLIEIYNAANPEHDPYGLNFTRTADHTGLKFLDGAVFSGEDYTEGMFDGFIASMTAMAGDTFAGQYTVTPFREAGGDHDFTKEAPGNTRKAWAAGGISGRPDLQRAAVDQLYEPAWRAYSRFTHRFGFEPETKLSPIGLGLGERFTDVGPLRGRRIPGVVEQAIQPGGGALFSRTDQEGRVLGAFAFNTDRTQAYIELFAGADLSTLLHEGWHLFSEILFDLSAEPGSSERTRATAQAILDHFGVADFESLADSQKEELARMGERYLMEGKAPSLALADAFRKFRGWLLYIYGEVRRLQDPSELSDDMREVFGRMLATDAEIQEANRTMGYREIVFSPADRKYLTKKELAHLNDLDEDADQYAEEQLIELEMRDLRKRNDKARQDKLKSLEKVARVEVETSPVYAVMEWLRTGRLRTDAWSDDTRLSDEAKAVRSSLLQLPHKKLGREGVRDVVGDANLELVLNSIGRRVYSKEGHHPDVVAGAAGMESGAELLELMASAPKLREASRALAEQRWKALEGDPSRQGRLGEAALDAVHNDTQARRMAGYLQYMRRIGDAQAKELARASAERQVAEEGAGAAAEHAAQIEAAAGALEAALEGTDSAEVAKARQALLEARERARAGKVARAAGQAARRALRASRKPVRQVRDEARSFVASTPLHEMRPGQTLTEERRLNYEAAQAWALNTAEGRAIGIDKMQKALLVHFTYIEQARALKNAERELKAMRKLNKAAARRRLYARASHFADPIYTLMDMYDLRSKRSRKSIEEAGEARESLLRFMAEQDEEGRTPVMADLEIISGESSRRTEIANAKLAQAKRGGDPEAIAEAKREVNEAKNLRLSWFELAPEEMTGLHDTLMHWAAVAKNVDWLAGLKEGRQLDDYVSRAVDAIKVGTPDKIAKRIQKDLESGDKPPMIDDPRKEKRKKWIDFNSANVKIEQLLLYLEGGTPGLLHQLLFQPIADAEHERDDILYGGVTDPETGEVSRGSMKIIREAFDSIPVDIMRTMGDVVYVESLDENMERYKLFMIALNAGNAGNLHKLAVGYESRAWSEEAILEAVNSNLTPEEGDAVQSIWNEMNRHRPRIWAIEKAMSGLTPKAVDPVAVRIGGRIQPGGYFPIVYDPEQDRDIEKRSERRIHGMFEGNFGTSVQTEHGHVKLRSDEYARPMLLDFRVVEGHIRKVVHDYTHRHVLTDLAKVVEHPQFRAAVTSRLSKEYADLFVPWLKGVANTMTVTDEATKGIEYWMRRFRYNLAIVAMGYKVTTFVVQPVGITQSYQVLKGNGSRKELHEARTYLASNVGKFIAHRADTTEYVRSKSTEMRQRFRTLDQTVEENIRRLQGETGALATVQRYAFWHIGIGDMFVSVPTWMSAYEIALANGKTEAQAIAEGDSAVRISQGSGSAKDLTAMQRGGAARTEAIKAFMTFYSYFATLYNREWLAHRRLYEQGAAGLPRYLADQMWLIVSAALLSELLAGRGPDDDEGLLEWMAKATGAQAAGSIPVVRNVAGAVFYGFDVGMVPLDPVGQAIGEALVDVGQIVAGIKPPALKAAKNVTKAAGLWYGVPVSQPIITFGNMYDVIWKDEPFRLRDVLFRKPRSKTPGGKV